MKIPVLSLDKPNKNGRIYPRDVIEKALQKYRDEYVSKSRAMVTRNIPTQNDIDLGDVVGIVKDIITTDEEVLAEVQFLNLPKAQGLEEALTSGKLYMRTSGIGKMTKQADGTFKIDDGYEFISCFLTNDPA